MDTKELGRKFRERRLALGKTQKEVAGLAGVSRLTLVNFENGTANLSLDTFACLAKVLGLDVSLQESLVPVQGSGFRKQVSLSDASIQALRKKRFPKLEEVLLVAGAQLCL